MIEDDRHPSLHVDFGKFLPKLASYVNYLFAAICLLHHARRRAHSIAEISVRRLGV